MDIKFAQENKNACEYTFANNFIWRKVYHIEVASLCDCLVIRSRQPEVCFSYPIGKGDKKAAIEGLLSECGKEGRKLILLPLLEEERRSLISWFPGKFLIEGRRDIYDYIYSREKLALLPGKKLHGKRNHIARFKEGGDWEYEEMTAQNIEDCRRMSSAWLDMRAEKRNEAMENEVYALHEAFDYRKELGLRGGVLKKTGKIAAFTIGEPLNQNTFVVHFEKAYPMLQGVYPMINQQFVLQEGAAFEYINREEDAGEPGLRKAKLSYYPEILLEKYAAVESPVVYGDREQDGSGICRLWKLCFDDREEDIASYLKYCMTEDNMLLIFDGDRPVAMASFLRTEFLCQGEYQEARYVYALGVHPQYRGRRLAMQLLEFAKEKYQMPLFLAPSEQALGSYYEKAGFRKSSEEAWLHFTAEPAVAESGRECFTCEEISAEEYMLLRKQCFESEGFVSWDIQIIEYAIWLNKRYGGNAVCITGQGGRRNILLYYLERGIMYITETTFRKEELEGILPYLLEKMGASTAEYHILSSMLWTPKQEKPEFTGTLYLGLTLG